MSKSEPTHYSYTVYADPAMADSFDQARFGGPIGSLQAEIQARVIAEFAGALTGKTALYEALRATSG